MRRASIPAILGAAMLLLSVCAAPSNAQQRFRSKADQAENPYAITHREQRAWLIYKEYKDAQQQLRGLASTRAKNAEDMASYAQGGLLTGPLAAAADTELQEKIRNNAAETARVEARIQDLTRVWKASGCSAAMGPLTLANEKTTATVRDYSTYPFSARKVDMDPIEAQFQGHALVPVDERVAAIKQTIADLEAQGRLSKEQKERLENAKTDLRIVEDRKDNADAEAETITRTPAGPKEPGPDVIIDKGNKEEIAEKESKEQPKVENKEEQPTTKKDWGQMTPAERRDALKSNDPQAWENLKDELLGKSNPSENADKISDLRDSETKTDKKDRSNNQDQEGKKAGMDLAKNTNLTDSYQKDRSDKSSKETQQTQTTARSTLSEKKVASHARDLEEQSRTTAQGKLTETAISQAQQESTQAQKIDQLEKSTAIGTILVGSLMGGLTSGVAIGLDSAFGTLGRGAGEQASISTGIKPKPEPVPPLTSTPTTTPAPTSTTASKPTPAPTPTSTSPSKPSLSQGSTPDCSAYRSSAQNLTASYTSGSMATSAYKSQMAVLRTKYKDCNETAEPPKTSVTSSTSTQGSTPDCSAYNSKKEALIQAFIKNTVTKEDYLSQMNALYIKVCEDLIPRKPLYTPSFSGTY
jgi:hypothetical protein